MRPSATGLPTSQINSITIITVIMIIIIITITITIIIVIIILIIAIIIEIIRRSLSHPRRPSCDSCACMGPRWRSILRRQHSEKADKGVLAGPQLALDKFVLTLTCCID